MQSGSFLLPTAAAHLLDWTKLGEALQSRQDGRPVDDGVCHESFEKSRVGPGAWRRAKEFDKSEFLRFTYA